MTIDLSINAGTHCSQKAIDVLAKYDDMTSLREYTDPENRELLDTIAKLNDVRAENIFVANGSGPILRAALYEILRKRTQSSIQGIIKYLLFKRLSTPLITPQFTYKKVPPNAEKNGIPVCYIPAGPDRNFKLDPADISKAISEYGDGIVYVVNPNNPSSNVQLTHDEIAKLVARHPDTLFWIDEAYYEYVDPEKYQTVAPLVTRHDNLIVSRSMSFAWGLASLRIGYFIADPQWVQLVEKTTVPYRIGKLQQEAAIASLTDETFLPFIREQTNKERARLREAMELYPNVEVFPSDANFLFCRFRDKRSSLPFANKLRDLGVVIKRESPHGGMRFDEYFRVSVGLPEENDAFIEILDEALSVYEDHESRDPAASLRLVS